MYVQYDSNRKRKTKTTERTRMLRVTGIEGVQGQLVAGGFKSCCIRFPSGEGMLGHQVKFPTDNTNRKHTEISITLR